MPHSQIKPDCASVKRWDFLGVLVENDAVRPVRDRWLAELDAVGRGRDAKAVAISAAAVVEQFEQIGLWIKPQAACARKPPRLLLPRFIRSHQGFWTHLALEPSLPHAGGVGNEEIVDKELSPAMAADPRSE